MNDIYIEDSVSIENKNAGHLFILSCICLAVSLFGVMFATILFGIPLIIFIAMSVHFYYERHVAFDYTYTNGLLDIAKVRNNTKRKMLFSSECENMEIMGLTDDDGLTAYESGNFDRVIKAFVGDPDRSLMTAVFNADGKRVKILMEPSAELLNAMKRQYPSKVLTKKPMKK